MKKIKITQLVIKNTSELDFSFPLLWKLKKLGHDVSILYCSLSKLQFLRESKFFSDISQKIGIKEYDFSDFLAVPAVSKYSKVFFKKNYTDRLPFVEAWQNLKNNKDQSILKRTGIFASSSLDNFKRVPDIVFSRFIRTKKIFSDLDADIFLLGNRTKTHFYGREEMYAHFAKKKNPVVLLPHGTHEVHPFKGFIPYDDKGEKLASFCDFWSAFHETPWELMPEKRKQFSNLGYPGLDEDWFRFILEKPKSKKNNLTCTLILRKILPHYISRPPNYDPFTLNYQEMLSFLNSVAKACSNISNIQFLIKPHPSNNLELLEQILSESEIKNWKISQEPFYGILNETDFVISLFSTSLLIPVMAKIPTIIFETPLQKYVHDGWPLLAQMYTGMQFYSVHQSQLNRNVEHICSHLNDPKLTEADHIHLRRYYPDGSIEKCNKRIQELLKT